MQARFSGRMDALVQQLAETARIHSGAALSVCALGGYGRRSLCLHSDIDLLIVFEDAMGPSEERFVGALLQPLWDLGLTVGQHVRESLGLRRAGDARPRQRRVPAGAARRPLHRRRRAALPAARRLGPRPGADNRRRLLDALLQLVDERHAPFNETVYQLEPDIKNAPGGLRDIAATRHIRLLQARRHRHRARSRRAAARRGRGVPAARPLDAAPRERPRRERADPRAAGEGGRDVRLRGPAVAAARGSADGRLLPPRAGVVAGADAGAARAPRRRAG